jgi:cell division protein FtsI/penicillin-binding protein 2
VGGAAGGRGDGRPRARAEPEGRVLQKEFKRFYPNNDLAAQVLGYVGSDDTGLGGLEQEFDDEMHGAPGHMLTRWTPSAM